MRPFAISSSKKKPREKKRRSPATVVRYLATLSHLFSIAVKEWEWATDNPVFKVRKPKEPTGRLRYLSREEIASLLSCCKKSENPHLFAIVLIALQMGMCKGETLSLKWEDIDFSNKWAYLRDTKNGSPRPVPLSDTLIALLEKTHRQNISSSLLFPSPHDHSKSIDFRSAWLSALKKASVADCRFHDLRHTAASYLAMEGYGYGQIGGILGHKTVQMTKRYVHLSHAIKRNMTTILENLCSSERDL